MEAFNTEFNDGRDLGLIHHKLCYRIIAQKGFQFYKSNFEVLSCSNFKTGTNENDVFLPGGYDSMANLVSHADKMDEHYLFPLLLSATAQLKMLHDANYLPVSSGSTCRLTKDDREISEIIVHFLQVMKFNTHGIIEAVLQQPSRPLLVDVRSIGCGVFPTLCLLNTSCDHNIAKYNVGTKVVGVVSKKIKKGEEISDNYYPSAAFLARDERRKWLKEHYWFDCECRACEEDLPLLKDMPDDPQRFICDKCGNRKIVKETEICDKCKEVFNYPERLKEIIELKENMTNMINIYSSSMASDPVRFSSLLQKAFTRLSSIVGHPYKFLVIAEQQYLKSIKQIHGNNSFIKG